jgi:hypothetical protein
MCQLIFHGEAVVKNQLERVCKQAHRKAHKKVLKYYTNPQKHVDNFKKQV